MLDGLFDKIDDYKVQKMPSSSLSPALTFWIGGLIAIIHSQGWNWNIILNYSSTISFPQFIVLFLGFVILVTTSSNFMRWFQFPLLRLVEGYWPRSCNPIKLYFVKRQKIMLEEKEKLWDGLAKRYNALNNLELDQYASVDSDLDNYPSNPTMLLPTRVGNIMRAAEEYPLLRYGLNTSIMWPRFWLILPENVKRELSFSREAVNERVLFVSWSILFSIWGLLDWRALILSFLGAAISYSGLVHAACSHGDLLRASFDLYRIDLFKALDFPTPTRENEYQNGVMLTHYLKRNLTSVDLSNDSNLLSNF